MKKIIKKTFLVLLIVLALCAVTVTAAETTPSLKADNQSVVAGDSIVIPVLIQNNTGVMGMGLDVTYDGDVFESPSITRGTVLANGTFNDSITDTTKGTFKVLWSDTSENKENGTLFSMIFKVKSSAKAGDYSITIKNRQGDTFNEAYEDISMADCSCTVSVSEKENADDRVLKSIAITKQPDKTLYGETDFFDDTGMEVTATYTDGSTEVVTDYTVKPDMLGVSDTEVTVTYFENGVSASATVAVEVQASLGTNSTASSIAVNGYYGVAEYIGYDFVTVDEDTETEIGTDFYDVNIVLPEGEVVTEQSIVVKTFDKNAVVKSITQDSDGNWVVMVYAQDVNFASKYTIKLTETTDEAEIKKGRNDAASWAIVEHEDAFEGWFAEKLTGDGVDKLTEEYAITAIAEYLNAIPEVVATGYEFTAEDIGILMLDLPVKGDADEPKGVEGLLVFEAGIEDGENTIYSDTMIVYIEPEEYFGISNLEIVQNCKKLLDSKRMSLKDTNAKTKEDISSYIAEVYTQVLKAAGYSIEIKAEDVTVAEYIEPVAGNLDNPSGTDGSITYAVQINCGKSTEITNEKTLTINAEMVVVYNIAAMAGANGTITPAGNNSVLKGGEISFVITPATGYKIESVLVDQVSVGAVGTYKFTDVQANHTIFATFVKTGTSSTPPSSTNTPPAQTECKHSYVFYNAAYFESGGYDWKKEKCSKCSHIKTTYYRIAGVSVGERFTVGNLQYEVISNATYNAQVKLVKVTNKNIKTLKVPGTVKYKSGEFRVIKMADGLCRNFKKLKKVVIGSYVKEIPRKAFYKCKKLKTVEIGDEVTLIGDQAFYGCTALKKVDTGLYLTSIGKKAFYGCTALTDIFLSNIKKIGDSAFMNCKKLEYISMYSIKTIGKKAFYNCKKLSYVIISSKKLQSVGSKAFINIPKNADIELLESKFNKYKKLLKGKCPKGVNFQKF